MKICCICGARPNFMKMDAVMRALRRHSQLQPLVVHTGQHYDRKMSKIMFEDLGLPQPDIDLGVGSASHAVQTARIMERFEPVVLEHRPDVVLVVGDVNSTVACALVAVKLGVPVAHVEAGLRSFDWSMPEEINRMVTDRISRWLFVSEPSGVENLEREGTPPERIFFVGNVMIDTLTRHRDKAEESDVLERLGLGQPGRYAVLTLHRPANVDDRERLVGLVQAVTEIQSRLPVAFPVHPRTAARLREFGLYEALDGASGVRLVEPLGYLDFLKLMAGARLMMTDSGGIQEETTILRVPCLTLRENTERPATVAAGFNQIIGTSRETIVDAVSAILEGPPPAGEAPELWDGRAGERVVDVLLAHA